VLNWAHVLMPLLLGWVLQRLSMGLAWEENCLWSGLPTVWLRRL